MKRSFSLIFTLLFLAILGGCGGEKPATAESFAMDTVMQFTLYGKEKDAALTAAQREMNRLESLLSRSRSDSPVARLNATGTSLATGELAALLCEAKALSAATGGAFDPSIAPVVDAWGFTGKQYHVPTDAELAQLLPLVGAEGISTSGANSSLSPGMSVDFGGIAKGYAADRAAALLEEFEISSGVLSLGGNVYACGSKPDGSPWRAGIQDPRSPEGFVGTLTLTNAFAVTSGGYQRYFEEGGMRYHHILNPATGYPTDSGLISVTIVATREEDGWAGTRCDAFSTALFVMGEEKALDFWRSGAYAFDLVLVTADQRVVVSEGLSHRFAEEAKSGYVYETVSKATP